VAWHVGGCAAAGAVGLARFGDESARVFFAFGVLAVAPVDGVGADGRAPADGGCRGRACSAGVKVDDVEGAAVVAEHHGFVVDLNVRFRLIGEPGIGVGLELPRDLSGGDVEA